MTNFPTRYSTLSAPALAEFISERYGIPPVQCRYKLRGVSDTYHIRSNDGEFILKIFRSMHRSQEELYGEIALLRHLRTQGISVADPIKDQQGNILQSFQAAEGIRYGILYAYAPGASIIEQSDDQVVQSAQYLAKLHQVTQNLELPYNRKAYTIESMLHAPLASIRPAYDQFNLTEIYSQLQSLASQHLETLQQLNTASFSKGYCHYDYMPKNWHHDEQGNIILFDFDFAGSGWLMNDIASYAIYVSLLTPSVTDAQRRLKLFINNYSKIKPVQSEELKALPQLGFLFILFYLQYQYENFEDHTNVYFGARFLRERMKQIDYYQEIMEGLF